MKFERVTTNPNIMQGRPCVRGMRITVGLIVNLIANGMTSAEIIENYPDVEEADIRECLQYAALLTEEKIIPYEETPHAVLG